MTVKFKYYVAKGDKADAVKANIIKMAEDTLKKQKALMRDYGATNLMIQGHTPAAIGFNEAVKDKPYLIFLGDKDGISYYRPNLRYAAGKNLLQRLYDASCFDGSSYACHQFKLGNFAFTPRKIYKTTAWMADDNELMFEIPYSDDSPFPDIPEEFLEITAEQYYSDDKLLDLIPRKILR